MALLNCFSDRHLRESQVRAQVEKGNHGKIVAIDIETGAFEVDSSEIAACSGLEARHPDAQIWIVRIGSQLCDRPMTNDQ